MKDDREVVQYFGNSQFDKFGDTELLPPRISIDSIKYDIEGFRILLKDENCVDAKCIRLSFEDFEYYSVSPNIPDKSLDLFETSKWAFYISRESFLIERFHNETHGLYKDGSLKHYVIVGVNDETIEVLSQSRPVFDFLP